MSQGEKIMKYLEKHPEGITPMEAFTELRITKLATRVSELIDMGIKFDKVMESKKNKEGQTVRYMRYYLVEA